MFNRGQAINVAADFALRTWREPLLFVMHDVDIVPSAAHFERAYLPLYSGRIVLAHPASAWTKYRYPTFLGGALAMTSSVFLSIGGMPHTFFGWGGEDDVVYDRLSEKRMLALMAPALDKDETAYEDLERLPQFATSEYKRAQPKSSWMNLDKRELLRRERANKKSAVKRLEQARAAVKYVEGA